MNSKNVIELNGNRYDAVTGKLLGESQVVPVTVATPQKHKSQTVDGVFHSTQTKAKTVVTNPVVAKTVATPLAIKPQPIKVAHATSNHTTRQPQVAKTLMRSAVKKPNPSFKKQIQVQGTLQAKAPSLITPKTSVYSISPHRLSKASSTPQSPHIARFTPSQSTNIKITVAPLAVQAPPNEPLEAPTPKTDNKPLDIFEQAIANANNFIDTRAHNAAFKKKARRHVATMTGGVLALLVIGGFLVYRNIPSLQLKVASIQAGVPTSAMPDFKAAGFTYASTEATPGKLTFALVAAGKGYKLSQQTTNWSDADLLHNLASYEANGTPNYSRLEVGATTVYRFSNNSATWIKNGAWYQLSTEASLSDAQVKAVVQNS